MPITQQHRDIGARVAEHLAQVPDPIGDCGRIGRIGQLSRIGVRPGKRDGGIGHQVTPQRRAEDVMGTIMRTRVPLSIPNRQEGGMDIGEIDTVTP